MPKSKWQNLPINCIRLPFAFFRPCHLKNAGEQNVTHIIYLVEFGNQNPRSNNFLVEMNLGVLPVHVWCSRAIAPLKWQGPSDIF
jgi:hypothetical protein